MKALSPIFIFTFVVVSVMVQDKRLILLSLLAGIAAHYLIHLLIYRKFAVPKDTAVLITGCSTGIGEDAALTFSDLGFYVFATVRNAAQAQALKEKSASKEFLLPLIVDITKENEINQAFATVSAWVKQVPGRKLISIINNAGACENAPIEYMPISVIKKQFEVNVVGQIAVTQTFLPLLRQALSTSRIDGHFPRVVFVSSLTSLFPSLLNSPYCASKAAVETLVDCLRGELAPWGIIVSSVIPGTVQTAFRNKHFNTLFSNNSNNSNNNNNGGVDVKADPSVMAVYKKAFEKRCEMDKQLPLFVQPVVATKALLNAVLEKYPSRRYLVGHDAHLMAWVVQLLPEIFIDIALSGIMSSTSLVFKNLLSPLLPLSLRRPHQD